MLAMLSASGCLVPLSLQQQNPTDGGQLLVLESAEPPLGTLPAQNRTSAFQFTLQVNSDSPALAGRLCVQLNQSCCMLQPEDPSATRCLLDANVVPTGDPNGYTVSFEPAFAPCSQNLTVPQVFVVPVLASGGFDDSGSGFVGIQGFGIIDTSHYWTVICP